jgi:hypothetical protein
MPTEAVAVRSSGLLGLADVRILRLALGAGLSMAFSQAVAWDLSFVAPVFTILLLSLPLPPLPLGKAIGFVVVLFVTSTAGLALLPMLLHQRAAGVLLLALALFGSFYHTARGGSMLLGTFATMGIALTTAVGTVSIDAVLAVIDGLVLAAVAGIPFTWLAHAIFPDFLARVEAGGPAPGPPPAKPKPSSAEAARSARRSLLIVLPISLWFVLSSASASYLVVMIKVSQMGQQSSVTGARAAAKSFLLSTVIGGLGAIIAWQLMKIWPSLLIYSLLIVLAALVMGQRIFAGRGMHPASGTWSYALITMLIILAPAVLDGAAGSAAGTRFWERLAIFIGATLYGTVAVTVHDAFFPPRPKGDIR